MFFLPTRNKSISPNMELFYWEFRAQRLRYKFWVGADDGAAPRKFEKFSKLLSCVYFTMLHIMFSRLFIWRSMLQLPENHAAYAALVDKGTHPAFSLLHEQYPIKSRKLLRVLQRSVILLIWANFSTIHILGRSFRREFPLNLEIRDFLTVHFSPRVVFISILFRPILFFFSSSINTSWEAIPTPSFTV
jgi:hypothetical protein